jgi:uncharacterized peroxidase-related enzyme
MSFVASISEEQESMSAILKPYPEVAGAVSMMTEYVMRSEDVEFSLAQRELIATFVSDLNACNYAARTHQATAEALGIDACVFDCLLENIDSAPVEAKLKPVLRYVKKLTETPEQMTKRDADEVFEAGWEEKSFHFAVMICGMFNLYNRLLQGYGVENTAQFHQQSGRRLAEKGYLHVASIASE